MNRRHEGPIDRSPSVMEAFDAELDRIVRFPEVSAPSTLYHYTNWDGLIGILKSRKVWATDHRFTNDPKELEATDRVVQDVSRRLIESVRGQARLALQRFLDEFEQMRVRQYVVSYLACFSVLRDDALMWRRYGEEGSGVSIGLKTLPDEMMPKFEGGDLATAVLPVDYHEDSWQSAIARQFRGILKGFRRLPTGGARDESERLVWRSLNLAAAHLGLRAKDGIWSPEKEWRMVGVAFSEGDVKPEFRLNKRGEKVPYLALPVRDVGLPLHVTEIILGPNQNHCVRMDELKALLSEIGYPHVRAPMPSISISRENVLQMVAA